MSAGPAWQSGTEVLAPSSGRRWTSSTSSGYVDLETGVLHRRGRGERETNKRRGAVRLTRGLLAHLRRWRASGGMNRPGFAGGSNS
jgi:hypothetical protein